MKKNKVIYYNDELNDEFSTAVIEPRIIDERYNTLVIIFECHFYYLFSLFKYSV